MWSSAVRGAAPLEKRGRVEILIVEADADLAGVWAAFLLREGVCSTLATSAAEAYAALRSGSYGAVLLDMELPAGAAIEVADFASYRDPGVPIIAVTADGFFSDSAIFELIPNARALLRAPLKLEDMVALVEHYGGRHLTEQRARASGA